MLAGPLLVATAVADRWSTFALVFFGEALSWAGIPMVGAAVVGAAGVLASQGTLHLWAVVVVGTIGAELGGLVGWWFGRRVATRGRGTEGGRRDKALSAGERVEERWGRLIVFMVPSWVSGALGMRFGQFARWNTAAAFLWTLGAALGAYGVGSVASGGKLVDSVPTLLVSAAALGAIVVLALHHRRNRAPA